MDVQEMVREWKAEHKDKLTDSGNQRIFCLVYGCVQKIRDCIGRRDKFYRSRNEAMNGREYYNEHGKDSGTVRCKKAHLINCVGCNVMAYLKAHPIEAEAQHE